MSAAWYWGSRAAFLGSTAQEIANRLAGRAAEESLEIHAEQAGEWQRSIELLQRHLEERLPLIRSALAGPVGNEVHHVVLEYDFKRRGLRMDCILLAAGAIFVVEFKRTRVTSSDREQVMRYAMNLLEFHKETRQWSEAQQGILVPIVALTEGRHRTPPHWPGFGELRWNRIAHAPLECDAATFGDALAVGVRHRLTMTAVGLREWMESAFEPSSSIIDAALSLYGNHDVVAIDQHAAPRAEIEATTREIRLHVDRALKKKSYHLVFLSGAPGAGKTLVGLDLVMRKGPHAHETVFVTGNAPLVDVLEKALSTSYRSSRSAAVAVASGYPRKGAAAVAEAATFKIVKAHQFLGRRSKSHRQNDGRVLVFDEAQRTYEQGRVVHGEKLEHHEADLILAAQRRAYPQGGAVVVALIGKNQAINRGERGMIAWLEAAEEAGWSFSVSDETLAELPSQERARWSAHPSRLRLGRGHLRQSLRYYRNAEVERWAAAVLEEPAAAARQVAAQLRAQGDVVWLTRDLAAARRWGWAQAMGDERVGLIASGQARRLAADGLFVELKPDIATWMLAPPSDIRSSNALETVQNQYQIQGLEVDYAIVCWDADLRRVAGEWASYRLRGDDWQKDGQRQVAMNSYRVLLTRARKGMLIYVPSGDLSGRDRTRKVAYYDGVAEFLMECGAQLFAE